MNRFALFLTALVLSFCFAGCGGGGSYGGGATGVPFIPPIGAPVLAMSVRGGVVSVVPGMSTTALILSPDVRNSPQAVELVAVPVDITITGGTFASVPFLTLMSGDTKLSTVYPPDPTATTATVTFEPERFTLEPEKDTPELRVLVTISSAAPFGMGLEVVLGSPVIIRGSASGELCAGTSVGNTIVTTITVKQSSLEQSLDSSTPSHQLVVAGSKVRAAVLRHRANMEPMGLTKFCVGLTTPDGVVESMDVVSDGGAVLASSVTVPTTGQVFNFQEPVYLPENQDTVSAVSMNISSQSVDGSVVRLFTVPQETVGYGLYSGTTVTASGPVEWTPGFTVYKTVPTVRLENLPSNGLGDGRLLRWSVTADRAGKMSLAHQTVRVQVTGDAQVFNLRLRACSESSYTTKVAGPWPDTGVVSHVAKLVGVDTYEFDFYGEIEQSNNPNPGPGDRLVLPVGAGQTIWFELYGDYVIRQFGGSVVATLLGDSSVWAGLATTSAIEAFQVRFAWSPRVGALYGEPCWTSSYCVKGLPSSGLTQVRTF